METFASSWYAAGNFSPFVSCMENKPIEQEKSVNELLFCVLYLFSLKFAHHKLMHDEQHISNAMFSIKPHKFYELQYILQFQCPTFDNGIHVRTQNYPVFGLVNINAQELKFHLSVAILNIGSAVRHNAH